MSKIDGTAPAHDGLCQCPACQSPFTSRRLPRDLADQPCAASRQLLPSRPISAPSDSAILTSLIRFAEAIGKRPHAAFDQLLDLSAFAWDFDRAHARPADGVRRIGDAELILFIAMRHLAGSPATRADLMHFSNIMQATLPMVRDHLFGAVLAEQGAAS